MKIVSIVPWTEAGNITVPSVILPASNKELNYFRPILQYCLPQNFNHELKTFKLKIC